MLQSDLSQGLNWCKNGMYVLGVTSYSKNWIEVPCYEMDPMPDAAGAAKNVRLDRSWI